MTYKEPAGTAIDEHREESALDMAAAQGPLPEPADDDEPGGEAEEYVQDSTEQEANASFLGVHLRP